MCFSLTFNGVRRDRKFNVKVGLVLGSCFVGNTLAVVMIAPAGVLGGRKMSQGLQGKYISTTQGSGCTGLGMNETTVDTAAGRLVQGSVDL